MESINFANSGLPLPVVHQSFDARSLGQRNLFFVVNSNTLHKITTSIQDFYNHWVWVLHLFLVFLQFTTKNTTTVSKKNFYALSFSLSFRINGLIYNLIKIPISM